jgi:superfamily II DNA/RNA helicase
MNRHSSYRRYSVRNQFRSGGRSRFGRRGGGQRKRFGQHIDASRYVKVAIKPEAKQIFNPTFRFEDLKLHPSLKSNIRRKGYDVPTPIQDQAIKQIMDGKDVLGIANTGTGKTAAFLIPIIQKMVNDRNETLLVIAPTRELAEQINSEFTDLTRGLNLYSVECTGGNSIFKQIQKIRKGCSVIIGTPGRLIDLNKRGEIDFAVATNIVLDEVDRMLDMGFVKDIKEIISQLPKQRQSLFFSATINRKVEELIGSILNKDYIKISVSTGETAQNVEQSVVNYSTPEDKARKLEEILKSSEGMKTLVFISTKRGVDKLAKKLSADGYRVGSIHGNKKQRERSRSIMQFKEGRSDILLATDVAARGLDISGISHVINYDEPNTYEDYIHRIGRTGRADRSGVAITFVQKR